MLLAPLVVARHPASQRVGHHRRSHGPTQAHLLCGQLQDRQRATGISIRVLGEKTERRLFNFELQAPEATLTVVKRAVQYREHVGRFERLEDVDLAAGEQRAVQLEAGVLGGRPDEGDGSPLDMGKKGVLLGPVEAVNLVAEQHRAPSHDPAGFGLLDDLPHPGDTFDHRAEFDELTIGVVGYEPGDGGLAGAGWSPEDATADIAAPDGIAQRLARAPAGAPGRRTPRACAAASAPREARA